MPPKKVYIKKDPIEHVLLRPSMYVGSKTLKTYEDYIAEFDEESEEYRIFKKYVNASPAILRIFIEVLSNAVDNVDRSRKAKIPCTAIKVNINKETGETTIWNDGDIIPIEMHPEEKMYNHTLIFGHLLTGSNYDDDETREISGLNGLGSKLSCIFSSKFTVKGLDPNNKKTFEQTWTNNMRSPSEPVVKNTTLKKGYTEVKYFPDFKQFDIHGYTDDIIGLYLKYVIDAAMLTKVKVYFNNDLINVNNLLSYSKLFDTSEERLNIKYENVEVVIAPSTEFQSIAFTNGIYNRLGGQHVESVCESFFRPLVEKFTKKDKPSLNIKDIKQFFKVFVTCIVDKPEFDSQSKERLESPKIKFEIKPADIKKLLKWSVIGDIEDMLKAKEMVVLKKSEKKKKGYVKIEGYDPANNAGGKYSEDCSLILCEGLSAKTYAVAGIDKGLNNKKGRDWFGILPLRGVLLNCLNACPNTIAKNKVIVDLIQAIGVKVETDYTEDKNFKTLNYGRVIILTDSDVDGLHISSLIMNFFHSLYPTLLKREVPYIVSMATPIVRVFNPKGDILFYDENRFRNFVKEQTKPFKSKYYKGLGTTKVEDVPDTFGAKMIEYIPDENLDINMNKVFHKKYSDTRKEWLENYDPSPSFSLDDEGSIVNMKISSFLNNELIKFSHADCKRSIPSLFDGLKCSQRKVLYAVKKRKLTYNKQSLKVAQLGGYVAEHTNYHHGEQNLYDTIIKLANEFPGSNNIPLLYRDGAFGCVDPNTDILLWNGNIVKAKYIKVNDELIGDDGTKRIVSKTVKGFDRMYEIEQTYGNNYKVNSQHILTLYYSGNKKIYWKSNCWRTTFYDNETKKFITKSISVNDKTDLKNPEHIKLNFQIAEEIRKEYKKGDTSYNKLSKKYDVSTRSIGRILKNKTWLKEFDINNVYNKSQLSKDEAYTKMEKFLENFSDDIIFDMNIQDYLKLPNYIKDKIKGVSNDSIINWEYKKVPIDPYIFGMWLGDGDQNGAGFSSEDDILVKEWVKWANYNGMSVIHSTNGDDHENYHYCLRRKCKSDKKLEHLPVGFYEHSSKNCIGCKTSKKIHESCDWVYDDYIDEDVLCIGNTITNSRRTDLHPFKEILKKYNLYNNKDILDEYLINNKETRLQLLAGFIDTDGTLKKNDNSVPHYEISQCNKTHGHLLDKLEFLCKSLGFKTGTSINETIRDTGFKSVLKTLRIFGHNIDIIPTKLHRKKIINYERKINTYYSIKIKEIERSEYVGWDIDKNKRFLLGDFTVTHNTRLSGGKDAASPRYIFTKMETLTPLLFREEDDILLEYVIDDGDVVEPKFYVPIIPMILVNGALGIGTGWSSSVPQYNPLDIIECVKTWLDNDGEIVLEDGDDGTKFSMLPEITPWYRGYIGKIEKSDSKYISYGSFEKDKSKVKITELPVGMWTDKFKEMCEDWLVDKKIKNMKNNSSYNKVDFTITESEDGFSCTMENLKLYTYLHVTNMVLFNEKEQIKKYNIETIINDFCKMRYALYTKRKNHIITILQKELKFIGNKARFVGEIIDKKLNIMNVDEDKVVKELEKRGYDKDYKNDEDEDKESSKHGYEYLLRLQVRTFTANKVKQLKDDIASLQKKLEDAIATTEKKMWLSDLKEFEDEYMKWLKTMEAQKPKTTKKK